MNFRQCETCDGTGTVVKTTTMQGYNFPARWICDECQGTGSLIVCADFSELVEAELKRARAKMPKLMNSIHESYAVILEEVDELWELVRMKSAERPRERVLEELVQIAAMCRRTAEDLHLLDSEEANR